MDVFPGLAEDLPVNENVQSNVDSSKETSVTMKGITLSAEECRLIQRRLTLAENRVKKEVLKPMKRDLDLYLGNHYPDMQKAESTPLVVNKILHAAETVIHGVAFNIPDFNVTPTSPEAEGEEDIARSIIKKIWKEANNGVGVQREAKRTLKDKVIFGTGILLVAGDTHLKEEDENGYSEVEDTFYARRINPGQFLTAPGGGSILEYMPYCAYIDFAPLDEVKANKNFKNTKNLKGSTGSLKNYFDKAISELSEENRPDDIKYVKLYHYYEYKRRLHAIFCLDKDGWKLLFVEKWAKWLKCYPFRYMQGPGSEDCFYGKSICSLLEAEQIEENEVNNQLSNYLRIFQPRYQTEATLRGQQEAALECYEPGTCIQNLDAKIDLLPVPQVPQFLFESAQAVDKNMALLSATDQYQWGNAPSKRTPELEVQAIQSVGGSRSQNDRQLFEIFEGQIAGDALAWARENLNKPSTLKLYDTYGQPKGFAENFTGTAIQGDFDLEVYVFSTSAPTNADKLKEIGYFTQAIQPLLQLGPAARPLARQILNALPDIRDVDKILDTLFPEGPPPGEAPGEPDQGPMGGMPALPPGGKAPPMGGPEAAQPPLSPDYLAALLAAQPQG